jgi:microcystin-dependent protein
VGTAGLGVNTNGATLGSDGCGSGSYVGDIHLTAASIAEGLIANGAILPIAGNTPLFALIGTTYGGNGITNFALPNLTALAPNGMTYTICGNGIFPSD